MNARPLRTSDLERYLLLANDLSGFRVRAVLDRAADAHAPPGATRLILVVEHTPVVAALTEDNRGAAALGRWRVAADVQFASLFGVGESLRLTALNSLDGRRLHYGSALLGLPLGSEGTRLVASVSYSKTTPEVDALPPGAIEGRAFVARMELEHPLIRSRDDNLLIYGGIAVKRLADDILDVPYSRDRLSVLSLRATYSSRDDTGTTDIGISLEQGIAILDATSASAALRSRASGSGLYTAVTLDIARQLHLGDHLDLAVAATGQLASRGLLASEQCGYGGAQWGRAFDDNQIAGDACLMGSVELRYTLERPWLDIPFVQLYPFYDAGEVWQQGTLLPTESRSAFGQSAGAGIRVASPSGLSADVALAFGVGGGIAQHTGSGGRIFAIVRKDF